MKVLVTGAAGQLGSHLCELIPAEGFELLAFSSQELDITSEQQVLTLASSEPAIIVNAAAYTAVDKAEVEFDQAYAVNEQGVANLVKLAEQLNIPLINVSTDYVFDGSAQEPYAEDQVTSPLGVYGKSKRAGEMILERSNCEFVNIRTSWVFSEHGNNFLKTMLRLGKARDALSIVADQRGCPTYAGDLARGICALLSYYQTNQALVVGHFHYAGDTEVSWFEFAKEIFSTAQSGSYLESAPALSAIATSEYPTPAARPAYSVLSSTRFQAAYGHAPSDWKVAIKTVLAVLKAQ